MRKDLVIAKYKEDTSWSKDIDASWNVIVYDKDGDIPNIGRDSHTFLYHICLNYHNLADTTVFSQGSYVEHCAEFTSKLETIEYGKGYTPLSDRLMKVKKNRMTFYKVPEVISNCQDLFGLENKDIEFPYGAFMAVDKENILKRPLSYYLNILTLVSSSDKYTHELEYLWPQVLQ